MAATMPGPLSSAMAPAGLRTPGPGRRAFAAPPLQPRHGGEDPRRGVPRAGPRINGPPDVAQNGAEPAVRAEAEPGGPAVRPGRRRQAGSTDWVASSLTRRFGIAGGLAWLGVLSFGVVSEQIKTRLEEKAEREGTKDVVDGKEIQTSSGLRYTDVKIGGGSPVQRGFLVVLDYKGTANDEVFEDTKARGKPIVFTYGGRPFTGGLCKGVEEALSTMKTGGVRRVIVPPVLGFGEGGTAIRPTLHAPGKEGVVPPGATLEYELSLLRVSIPPS